MPLCHLQVIVSNALTRAMRGQAGHARIQRSTDDAVAELLEGDDEFLMWRNAIDPGYHTPGGQGHFLQWLSYREGEPRPDSNTKQIMGASQLYRDRAQNRLSQRNTDALGCL